MQVRVPTQERAKRSRAAIVEAAVQDFSERGYGATTAKSIAARAGVAVGTFYQYFREKDDVLREIARSRALRVQEETVALFEMNTAPRRGALKDEARVRMRRVVEAVTALHREDPGLHAVLTERRHADPALDEVTSGFERALVERVESLLKKWGRGGPDPRATAFVLCTMVEGAVHAHVLGRPMVDDKRFRDALVEALVRVALGGE